MRLRCIRQGEVVAALQVAVNRTDPTTQKREIRGLVQCCSRFGLSEGYILTMDTEETIEVDGIKIQVVPAWKHFYTGGL